MHRAATTLVTATLLGCTTGSLVGPSDSSPEVHIVPDSGTQIDAVVAGDTVTRTDAGGDAVTDAGADAQTGPKVTTLGPGAGGYISTIKVHPTNHRVIYIATDNGGVARSRDGGRTWPLIMNGLYNTRVADHVISCKIP